MWKRTRGMRNRPAGEVRSGLCRPSAVMLVQKITYVCVLILRVGVAQNFASHLPAGLQMLHAPMLNPQDLKRKHARFSGLSGAAGPQTVLESKEKRPARGGIPIALGAWGLARQLPARSVSQLCRVFGHGGPNRRSGLRPQSYRAPGVAGALFRAAS